ncbi:MAG: tRNA (N6-isopentenyl adenosine(37)-C2)-methylthiotransferase MiaB [Bacilli bacterium]|nr:tRNA (N6-isopentenyl adenosine(37)-C2)-methylthiotransferase MiaB [Bacilli bacterium]
MSKRVACINLPRQKDAAKKADVTQTIIDKNIVPDNLKALFAGKYFYIKTFGCQANIRDEEVMAGYLTLVGMKRTDNQKEADIAIINTCAVRENAEEKVYGEIGTFKCNKERNKNFMLVLAGCVMQEEGIAVDLLQSYPWISLVIGTHDVHNLLNLLSEALRRKQSLINVRSFADEIIENMPSQRLSSYQAYVNISYGCDKFCTYCIVPYTRGRERSRAPEDIINECKKLVDEGYKEITLLGQNVNSYGLDLKNGTTFASLLESVAKLGVPRLKFLTSYPSQFSDDMIEVMAKYDNIEKWLHFPVQSGSTSCLKRMARRYTRDEYLEKVRKIRERMPDIALTTDIIVGFPGETEEEFADTLKLAEEVSYSAAFTFIYSARQGTPAAKMEQVPSEVQHERFDRLKALIDVTTAKHSSTMIGKTFDILVQGPSKRNSEVLSGYATNGKLVNFKGPAYLTGCIVPVKILESHVYSLIGELAEDPLVLKAKDVAFLMSKDPLLKEYLALDENIRSDASIKELGDALVREKKAMGESFMDKDIHEAHKAEYEKVLEAMKNHPLLANRNELMSLVEERLLEVRDYLR